MQTERITLNHRELEEARGWLADCQWADEDADSIDEMPARMITRAVERHYDGGLAAFVLASGMR